MTKSSICMGTLVSSPCMGTLVGREATRITLRHIRRDTFGPRSSINKSDHAPVLRAVLCGTPDAPANQSLRRILAASSGERVCHNAHTTATCTCACHCILPHVVAIMASRSRLTLHSGSFGVVLGRRRVGVTICLDISTNRVAVEQYALQSLPTRNITTHLLQNWSNQIQNIK